LRYGNVFLKANNFTTDGVELPMDSTHTRNNDKMVVTTGDQQRASFDQFNEQAKTTEPSIPF
jgi:hypothetical protein